MNGQKNRYKESEIIVKLKKRQYKIIVGQDIIPSAGLRLRGLFENIESCNIISDRTVAKLYLDDLTKGLNSAGIKSNKIIISPGEISKGFKTLENVLEQIILTQSDRKTPIIALGGGVVGDIAGFAASIVLRGVPFIQIPTTLLAQVDSSVGGKTGINSAHGKNLIGSFHQPRLVLADTKTLNSLSKRELLAGYAEVVKYAVINKPSFFSWLENNYTSVLGLEKEALEYTVSLCCKAKAEIVMLDELETSERALLNLGHTFGHALETEAGYNGTLLHGEAVAAGLVIAAKLSTKLGLCSNKDYLRIKSHFDSVGLPTKVKDLPFSKLNKEKLLSHISHDKKAKNGWPNFVLINGIGKASVEEVDQDFVQKTLSEFIENK